jgi:hypothetical protein
MLGQSEGQSSRCSPLERIEMEQRLENYLVRRIKQMHSEHIAVETIIQQLGAVSDTGHYRRPQLRELIKKVLQ